MISIGYLVFDPFGDIDLYTRSTEKTNEKDVIGRTSGLIFLEEMVMWGAKYSECHQTLSSIATDGNPYTFFIDETKG